MEDTIDFVLEHYGIVVPGDSALTLDEKLEVLNQNSIKVVNVPEEEEEETIEKEVVEEEPAKQPEPQIIYVQEPPKELDNLETIERVLSDLQKLHQFIKKDFLKTLELDAIYKKVDELRATEHNRSNPQNLFK